MSGVSSGLRHDTGEIVEVFTRQQSWYEAQGLWGVLVLVIFSAYYLLALPLARRGNAKGLIIMAVVGIAFSVITGFSIGSRQTLSAARFGIPLAFLTDQYYIQDRSFINRHRYDTESDITVRWPASGV